MKHTGRHASATEWNYYLNKGMVLVLLRDESFIENKNTKYLEVMGKLETEIWRRRVGDGDGELKICFGGKEKVDAFTINWLSLVHVNCSTMDCCDWSLFIISHSINV